MDDVEDFGMTEQIKNAERSRIVFPVILTLIMFSVAWWNGIPFFQRPASISDVTDGAIVAGILFLYWEIANLKVMYLRNERRKLRAQ